MKEDFHDVTHGRVEQQRLGRWDIDVLRKAHHEEISADLPRTKSVAITAEIPTPRTLLDV